MSDKEWYEGLTGKELSGKHVHVVFKTGTVVDGRLEWDGLMYVSNTRQIAVLGPGDGGSWELSPGVESVSLLWDERDWEQIPLDKADEGDYLVVGSSLQEIHCSYVKKPSSGFWDIDDEPMSCIYFDMASCALRKKPKLPTKPGTYQSADGTLLIRLKSKKDSWMYASRDFAESGAFIDGEQAAKYLPLTPVHFVDGRAE